MGRLGLTAATLLVATLGRSLATAAGAGNTGRVCAEAAALLAILHYARDWMATCGARGLESWRFVKQIFLLLLAACSWSAVARQIIRPEWIESLAGQNDLLANRVAVVFGCSCIPVAGGSAVRTCSSTSGMHPGPLLA